MKVLEANGKDGKEIIYKIIGGLDAFVVSMECANCVNGITLLRVAFLNIWFSRFDVDL